MIETLRSIGIDCIVVFGGALLLALTLRFGAAVLDALPIRRARHAFVARVRPLAAVMLRRLFNSQSGVVRPASHVKA